MVLDYIDECVTARREVAIYVTNGFKIRGIIKRNSPDYIVVKSDGKEKMIFKHAISTIEPV